MGKTAFIFPGQGAQAVGMARDVFDECPVARTLFERADECLGFPLKKTCFEGPPERLERTDVQQPAIFVASAALWEALKNAGVNENACAVTAGLSLGEYTALYFAGALSFDDALRLVRRRGQLMQQAAENSSGGMISLIGADEASASALCDRAMEDDVLAPANFNCPGQIVIAGSSAACDRAMGHLSEAGLRGVRLPVAGAFHTVMMAPAAEGLAAVLKETSISPPRIGVLSNVNADYHAGPDDIRSLLEKQLTHSVRWQRGVERLIADGVDRFVEIGPGRILTGLMRKIDRNATTINVSTMEGVGDAAKELH